MLRIAVILFITFTTTVSANLTDSEIREADTSIRKCFNDLFFSHVNGPSNGTCKDTRDFINLATKYRELDKKHNESDNYLDSCLFILEHKFSKDYILNHKCVNLTSCKEKIMGYSSDTTEQVGIIWKLFLLRKERVYDNKHCHDAELLRECVEKTSLQTCDKNTKRFVLDVVDQLFMNCNANETFQHSTLTGTAGASGHISTWFIFTTIITYMLMLHQY